jgi:hypothetical protein
LQFNKLRKEDEHGYYGSNENRHSVRSYTDKKISNGRNELTLCVLAGTCLSRQVWIGDTISDAKAVLLTNGNIRAIISFNN